MFRTKNCLIYFFNSGRSLKKSNDSGLAIASLLLISWPLIIFLTAISTIFPLFVYTYISIIKTDKRTDYLGKEIAIKIEYLWNQDHKESIDVVLGDEWFAGNLSYHLKSRPTWEGSITKNKLDSLSKFTCIDNICIGSR